MITIHRIRLHVSDVQFELETIYKNMNMEVFPRQALISSLIATTNLINRDLVRIEYAAERAVYLIKAGRIEDAAQLLQDKVCEGRSILPHSLLSHAT